MSSFVEIKMLPNGPLRLEGDFKIVHPDGKTEEKSGAIHLCRCGQSSNKPYCDGSHRKVDFKG